MIGERIDEIGAARETPGRIDCEDRGIERRDIADVGIAVPEGDDTIEITGVGRRDERA